MTMGVLGGRPASLPSGQIHPPPTPHVPRGKAQISLLEVDRHF